VSEGEDRQEVKPSRFGFALVLVFLVFEYSRPQDVVPAIGALRPTWLLLPLMFIAWAQSPNFRKVANPQLALMLLMAALLAVYIPLAVNHHEAFEQTEDYLLIILPFCVSVILFVDTRERVLSLMRWWVLLALYIAVRAILGHGIAGSNFLGDPNDVSLLLNMMLPFALCMLVYERRGSWRVIYLGISLMCLAGVVATGSRGGFVGLIAMLAFLWLISPRKLAILLALCILAVGAYNFAPQSYWKRMSTIQTTDLSAHGRTDDPDEGSAEERLKSWRAAWEMFKDHPLGVGPGNFPIRFPEYQGKMFGEHGMWGRQAHSLWLTLLSELGIPGTVLYALLLRANWRSLRRLNRVPTGEGQDRLAYLLSVAFMASLAGFFASATFLSVLFYVHYWYLSAMIVAAERTLASALPAPGEPVRSDPVTALPGVQAKTET